MSHNSSASIHWFRHGLRLHDNPALLESIRLGGEFYPIFIFDGKSAGTKSAGYNRMRFLLEALQDLDNHFKKVGGRLFVFHGQPVKVLSNLFQEWGISKLTFEQDSEAIWHARDDAVKRLCDDNGVEWVEEISHTLWDPNLIIENNGGSPPLTYMLFNQVAALVGDPPRPVEEPDFSKVNMSVDEDHDRKYGIPSLEQLSIFPECPEQNNRINKWVGGESRALELLESRLKVEKMAFSCGTFMPNQSFPDLVGPPLSMSAYLRFGCLSIRKLYWELRDAYSKIQPDKPFTTSVSGQLIWREYFYTMSVNNINFNKMKNNPICLDIPWYNDEEKFKKWKNGETGFPWIDAIMKQLLHEGWIHHAARHATATFLTRGDLWLNWVDGQEVFDKHLIDADWSVLAGNWMWMSSSAFEDCLQCPKCFCPVLYGRKLDPKGIYVKRYLPVLKHMPLRYLFEPWKAPKSVQEKARCIVGVDYPMPMVDHEKASKECYNLMLAVKSRLKDIKDIKYCGPANAAECRMFVFMGDHPMKGSCQSNSEDICDGLENI